MARTFMHNQLEPCDILVQADRATKEVVSTSLIIGIEREFSDLTAQVLTTYSSESGPKYIELKTSATQTVIHRNNSNTLTIIRAGEILYESK